MRKIRTYFNLKKILGDLRYAILFTAVLVCFLFTASTKAVYAEQVVTDTKTDTIDGMNYELWKDNGDTRMVLLGGGEFSCSWSNINNALFRIGKKFDNTKTYDKIGNISVQYSCDYNPDGNSYLCIYGWSSNPLVEYYIVDSWGSWRPPVGAAPGQNCIGQITVDGGTYDVYRSTRVNQPSIEGNTTFEQYWSVRTEKRSEGTVSVTEHFKAWEKLGLKLGTIYETALTVEGYQSSGSATVSKNILTIGGTAGDDVSYVNPGQNQKNGQDIAGQNVSSDKNTGSSVLLEGKSFKSSSRISTGFVFSSDKNSFILRAENPSKKTAKVKLYVGGKYKGTFRLAGGDSEYLLPDIATGKGKKKVELRYSGTVKLKIESLTVCGSADRKKGKLIPVRLQCEDMNISGPYAGRMAYPFKGTALYANGDSISTSVCVAGGKYTICLCGASDCEKAAKADLYVNGEWKGTFTVAGTGKKSVKLTGIELDAGYNTITVSLSEDDGTWDLYADYIKIR